jgi:diguanylate cyclase (GGDEF)-like protein
MIEFRVAAAIGLALLGVVWFRRRTGTLRHRAAQLQALVDERTRELTLRGDRLELADREKAALIAQLEAQSALLARHAQEDGLTGLANRRELDRSLDAALQLADESQQPLSLALVDIDHFKRINDRFGHGVGDDVLRGVAKVIRDLVRPPMLAGRSGGEEFALILPAMPASEAEAFCETLRSQIEHARAGIDHADFHLTVSIGLADVAGLDTKAAYAAADKCLYQAKHGGRNRVVR